jgi:large conductance mechanosensitive channel
MLSDFKAFIARGNVLDLAIGVIIGAAFTTIVKTFTDGIIMPFVGLITGGVDFKQKVWNLGSMPTTSAAEIEAAQKAKEPLILYGQFINDVITFLIVAFLMYLLAKYAVRLFKGLEADSVPSPEVELLAEIRDVLKAKGSA